MTGAAGDLPWPREHVAAAGKAYRAAAGEGLGPLPSVQAAEAAYLAAGGAPEGAHRTVSAMLDYLSREHGDWLFGPAQDWMDRNRAEPMDPADVFFLEDKPYGAAHRTKP